MLIFPYPNNARRRNRGELGEETVIYTLIAPQDVGFATQLSFLFVSIRRR